MSNFIGRIRTALNLMLMLVFAVGPGSSWA